MSGSSIGQIVGGVVGGVVGFFSGGPVGALKGASIGYSLGGVVDPPPGPNITGPRLNDKKLIVSTYGDNITLVYGPKNRLSGNVVWSTGLLETKKKEKTGGKGSGSSSTTTYSYRISVGIIISGRTGKRVEQIWGNGKLIFDATFGSPVPVLPPVDDVNGQVVDKSFGTHTVFDELHFWPGSTTQVPDPLIESYEGVGNVPAYRNESYVVLKDLQLADFGNSLPNLEFGFVADESITVAQVLTDICDRCGVSNPSVFGLTEKVDGYIVSQGDGLGACVPLSTAYFFDIAEQGGQIRFKKRGGGLKGTIPLAEMGARQHNEAPISPINYEALPTTNLPKQINVSFSDPALNYQTNTQAAFRDVGDSSNIQSIELPLTLSADQGRQIADRLLWLPWTARRAVKISVTDKWVRANPGDSYGIPVADQVLPYRVLRVARGDNGVVQLDMQQEDLLAYQSTATGGAGRLPLNELRLPGETRLVAMDSPIWRDSDDDSGFYWAVTASSKYWRGASILRSSDLGVTYETLGSVGVRTTLGDVSAATPSGPTHIWDRATIITVVLAYGEDELESVSELAVLNGANAAWLGNPNGQNGEWIQFATATLIAPRTYELTDLLRGRLGTEDNVGIHGANEVLVMATESSAGRVDFSVGDWNAQRLYKPVSTLTDQQDVTAQAFTNTGVGKKPYSVTLPVGVRDGSNNLTISWVRRTRLRVPGVGNGPVPLGEGLEQYEIDILDSPGGTVVNTLTSTSESVLYSAAAQTADGLTPGDYVNAVIYQISEVAGRGFPKTIKV